ncbi:N-acetylglucosamine kinase [Vagococcus fessus]|uniref:N-acetylglucosamine kinase n=1 Tax=Vagococcus fessus TaxID=120370 RepID=UPI001474891E|nr:BadF/BadG/BcrA/BcrD ATPase family protein [Vagococcus fessus]
MEFLIGIDCGGTSTKGTAYDLDGNKLMEVQRGQGNVLVNFEEAVANIQSIITKFLTEIRGKCQHILCGIAGIDGEGMKEKLAELLVVRESELTLMNDGQLGYLKHIGKEDGVFLIAGTGSLVVIRCNGEFRRVGGWGHLLGDEGGGYWLGKKVVKNYLNEEDQGVPNSLLSYKIKKALKVNTPREAVQKFMSLTKKEVASLAMVVSESEKEGDMTATKILEEAVNQLLEQLTNALHYFDDKQKINLAVAGSVVEKNDYVRQSLIENISPCYKFLTPNNQYDNTAAVLNYYKN